MRASTWYADGRVCDDHVRQHSFVDIGREIFSAAVLSLPLVQLQLKGTAKLTHLRFKNVSKTLSKTLYNVFMECLCNVKMANIF